MAKAVDLTGRIFDIERFGLVDGPGIRTVVFFKGCPLRCHWCHNPESQAIKSEMMFSDEQCVKCGSCARVCPEDAIHFRGADSVMRYYAEEKCTVCRRCVETCPRHAIEIAGYDITEVSLVEEIVRGAAFYRRSGGGVTLSGGEPLMQFEFCRAILRACHEEGIDTALDTSGYAPWNELSELLPHVDLFLYDIKHIDDEKHIRNTGVSNQRILDNLCRLVDAKKAGSFTITVRIPIIPGFNATEKEMGEILDLLGSLREIDSVEMLPCHPYGETKYKKLGREGDFKTTGLLTEAFLEGLKEEAMGRGLKVVLEGRYAWKKQSR